MTVQFNDKKPEDRLEELHHREEEELARILSQKYGVEYADLTSQSIDSDALRLLPETKARSAEIAPFRKIGKRLFVGMRSPERSDSLMEIEQIERLGYQVRRFMVSKMSLEHAWERYKDLSFATETEAGMLTLSNEAIQTMLQRMKNVNDVKNEVLSLSDGKDAHRVSHVLEVLMAGALALKASDVHIEPEQEVVRLRYRIDGVLMEILTFDPETYRLIASRIKLLSGLKLNLTDIAQDGRFTITIDKKEIEIRTSILPGNYGESAVMRILDPAAIQLKLEDLGFDSYLLETFKAQINKPNGMILNTGPTGSGKTTTLYAFLRTIYSPEIKIITIEDPIEYHLAGIVQTQVEKNYSFAQGLRSTLRQDPDVIMVGEIRDAEVASTAVHASLTGHLVFSTLHTNDAAGTFPRLIDMGVSADILGSAVTTAMAQRLVRRLCKVCKKEVPVDEKAHALIDRHIAVMPHPEDLPVNKNVMWQAVGCDACGNTGYKGRISIVEAILMDAQIEETIRTSSSERTIWAASWHQNIRTMQEDGIVKVLKGVTALDELARVVDLSPEGLVRTKQ